ncbi:EpsG family protein [Acinetobacter sp. YH12070]|uniref:EpsG family protein n=1 Tax=Acinetobacter sp. YH12070 TaxID=2601066 RepID=UPI0015D4631A|nr:EpsG family protein [Acinetobacter sp. YH12070]
MLIYWLVWGWITLLAFFEKNNIIFKYLYAFTFVFIILFVGFRYEIGVDWYTYLIIYDYLDGLSFKDTILYTDPMYGAFNYLSNKIGIEGMWLVNLSCSIILFYFLYKFSEKFKYVAIPFFVSYTYFIIVVSMNYVRQSVAISISLLALYFAMNNKKYKFLLLIFFASLFHKSAIFLIVIFPIFYILKFRLNKLMIFIYVFLSIIFITGALYYSSINGENIYTSSDSELSSSGALFRLTYHLIPIYLYLYSRNIFKSEFGKNIFILDFLLILIFYCVFLAFFYSTLSDRFNLYLYFFDVFVYAFLCGVYGLKARIYLLITIFLFSTLTLFIWFNYGNFADEGWIPYQNYLIKFLF